jgi:hypothetical protein
MQWLSPAHSTCVLQTRQLRLQASNAALMLAEMGDLEGAEKEIKRIARRAPGSADMRVALAALLWRRGDEGAVRGRGC